MSAVVVRVAAELRGRWRASLVLAALVGLVGGVAIATLAGARRTNTSFDRMIAAVEGWDVLVNPDLGTDTTLDLDAVGKLPEVTALSLAAGLPVFSVDGDGNPDFDAPFFAVAAMDDSSFIDHHRPLLRDGRLPDPSRADEILIGPVLADDLDVRAGDRIELLYVSLAQLEQTEAASVDELPVEPISFTVAGIAVDQASIVVDEAFADESVQLTSAFYAEHSEDAYFLAVLASLRDGADDIAAFAPASRRSHRRNRSSSRRLSGSPTSSTAPCARRSSRSPCSGSSRPQRACCYSPRRSRDSSPSTPVTQVCWRRSA